MARVSDMARSVKLGHGLDEQTNNASPWGGFKLSGWGREKGPYGLDLFTQVKSAIVNYTSCFLLVVAFFCFSGTSVK